MLVRPSWERHSPEWCHATRQWGDWRSLVSTDSDGPEPALLTFGGHE
jgi:hypothetical protein